MKLDLKKSRPPKTNIVNPDYKRRIIEEGPSSDSEQYKPKGEGEKLKIEKEDEKENNEAGPIEMAKMNE